VDKNRGFTLIELLVVIAIIALLMAILMPAINLAKMQAQAVVCQTRLRHWSLIFKLYTDDNNGCFHRSAKERGGDHWINVLRPYYNDSWDMLVCPSASKGTDDKNELGTFKGYNREFPMPDGREKKVPISYGINSWVTYQIEDTAGEDRPPKWFWRCISNAKGTNNIPVLGDSTHFDAWPHAYDEPPPTPDFFKLGDQGGEKGIDMMHFCINRHNGFINLLFMDWSVRKVGLKELWVLKWNREFDINGLWTIAGFGGNRAACSAAWNVRSPWLKRFPVY